MIDVFETLQAETKATFNLLTDEKYVENWN